jgi:hypothetical protein
VKIYTSLSSLVEVFEELQRREGYPLGQCFSNFFDPQDIKNHFEDFAAHLSHKKLSLNSILADKVARVCQ